MRELAANELHTVHGGNYSNWQTVTVATLSSAIALGSLRVIKTCSITQGLQVAGACGFLTLITAVGIISFLGYLPGEDDIPCKITE